MLMNIDKFKNAFKVKLPNLKDEIKNEEDERRFIDLIKNKDKAIKLITEKYG